MPQVLAIDITPSWTTAGVFTRDGRIVTRAQEKTSASHEVAGLIGSLSTRVANSGPVDHISLSAPGPLEKRDDGIYVQAMSIQAIRCLDPSSFTSPGIALAERLSAATDRPVEIVRNADAQLLGEWAGGAARRSNSVLGLWHSWDVQASLLVNGVVVEAENPSVSNIAHELVELRSAYANSCTDLDPRAGMARGHLQAQLSQGSLASAVGGNADIRRLSPGQTGMAIGMSVGYLAPVLARIVSEHRVRTLVLGGDAAEALGPLYGDALRDGLDQISDFSRNSGEVVMVSPKFDVDARLLGAAVVGFRARGIEIAKSPVLSGSSMGSLAGGACL